VLGVVVNDVPQRHGQYGYYGSASAPRPRRALPTVTTTTKNNAATGGPQRVELIDPDGAVSYAQDVPEETETPKPDTNGNGRIAAAFNDDSNGNGHPAITVPAEANGNGDTDGNGAAH
jgi:hypothetical protein